MTDENKHQYTSCLAGKGGKLETTVGWTVGFGKEVIDLAKKFQALRSESVMAGLAIFSKIALKT